MSNENVSNKGKAKAQIQALAVMGLLVAMEVILTRFLSIRTPIVTIGFGFIPVSLAAMKYGPLRAGIVGGLADFLGAVLFPIGAFFPGFTLTAFLAGIIYGIFFHKKNLRLIHIVLGVVIVNLVFNLGLNTYWLYLISGHGVWAMMPARLIKVAFMIPVQIASMQMINKSVGSTLAAPIQFA